MYSETQEENFKFKRFSNDVDEGGDEGCDESGDKCGNDWF